MKKMKNKLDNMFINDFIRLPRPFIRRFNLNTAVMLSEIYSEYTYWRDRGGLQDGGWFYSTIENIYYNTGLSKHQQLIASKELENYGIIKIKYHGMPKKRYFKFAAPTSTAVAPASMSSNTSSALWTPPMPMMGSPVAS